MSQPMHQYNGLILLAGYLHRLHVQDEILRLTGQARAGRESCLPLLQGALISGLAAMGPGPVPAELEQQAQAMLPLVERWYQDSLPRPRYETRLEWRVAATAGALCGEKQVNDGLLTLVRLIEPVRAPRFEEQSLFHQGRVRVAGTVVGALVRSQRPPEPELSYLERWYDELFVNRDGVARDLQAVGHLLSAQHPARLAVSR